MSMTKPFQLINLAFVFPGIMKNREIRESACVLWEICWWSEFSQARQAAVSSSAVWARGLCVDPSFIRGISLKCLHISCVSVPLAVWSMEFMWIAFIMIHFCTSQWTHRVSIRKYGRVMLYRDITSVCCQRSTARERSVGSKMQNF